MYLLPRNHLRVLLSRGVAVLICIGFAGHTAGASGSHFLPGERHGLSSESLDATPGHATFGFHISCLRRIELLIGSVLDDQLAAARQYWRIYRSPGQAGNDPRERARARARARLLLAPPPPPPLLRRRRPAAAVAATAAGCAPAGAETERWCVQNIAAEVKRSRIPTGVGRIRTGRGLQGNMAGPGEFSLVGHPTPV